MLSEGETIPLSDSDEEADSDTESLDGVSRQADMFLLNEVLAQYGIRRDVVRVAAGMLKVKKGTSPYFFRTSCHGCNRPESSGYRHTYHRADHRLHHTRHHWPQEMQTICLPYHLMCSNASLLSVIDSMSEVAAYKLAARRVSRCLHLFYQAGGCGAKGRRGLLW